MKGNGSKSTVIIPSLMLWVILYVASGGFSQVLAQSSIEHPNVILILADDMCPGDISAFNKGLTKTPTLDALIDQSIYFKQAYSGSPVCAPSRAELLTGHYPFRTGVVTLNQVRYPDLTSLSKKETTIADIFGQNGYVTGMVGKWHLGNRKQYRPLQRGFDESVDFVGAPDVPDSYFSYKLNVQGNYQKFTDEYLTDNLTRRAIDFVRRHKDEPFFLHLAHYAPHRPLSAPQEKIDEYLKKGFNQKTATIYAMIEIMDRDINKLIEELDRLGIRKKTVIIFASDNGPDPLTGHRFNKKLRGTKYTVYEGGIHVPLIVNWQGVIKPRQRDEIVQFSDIVPTLVDLCHLKTSPSLTWDGASISGLLLDTQDSTALPALRFWQWNRGVPFYSHNAAIREGNWKLVRPYVTRGVPDGESTEKPVLFNLTDDPFEQHDLAKQYPVKYDRLRILLRQWSRKMEYDRLMSDELTDN